MKNGKYREVKNAGYLWLYIEKRNRLEQKHAPALDTHIFIHTCAFNNLKMTIHITHN